MSKERKGKSTLEKEYEKESSECTFKPNIKKPDILKMTLTQRQPFSTLKTSENIQKQSKQLKASASQATLGHKKHSITTTSKAKSALKAKAPQAKPTIVYQPEILTSPQTLSPPSSNPSILNSSSSRSFGMLQ